MCWLGFDGGSSSAEVVQSAVGRLADHIGSITCNDFAVGGSNTDSIDVDNDPLMLDRNSPDVCASAGRALATLWEYGQTQAALRSAGAIVVHQQDDGAFGDRQGRGSVLTTAAALRGLLPISGESRTFFVATRRAAEFLICWAGQRSVLAADSDTVPCQSSAAAEQGLDSMLCSLPILLQAARAWNEHVWEEVLWRAVECARSSCEHERRDVPLLRCAARIEALLDLNCDHEAKLAVKRLKPVQTRAGFVSFTADGSRPWVAATALMAGVWYRLGERDRADRAVSWLARQWRPEGGFNRPSSRNRPPRNLITDLRECELFLRAVRWQVWTLFDGDLQALPDWIDDSDGRMQAVYRWIGRLPAEGRVVDVGCGAGRFLSRIAAARPQLRLAGVDISAASLAKLPPETETQVGSLLRIPYSDGAFDGALAVESLEHALLPSRAIEELCRVVRPGGWVLIIDKNRAFQPRSVHEPWEHWFAPRQVTAWLSRFCDHIHVEPIAHGPNARPDGLFLAWTARRR